jgi:hypothetical protein
VEVVEIWVCVIAEQQLYGFRGEIDEGAFYAVLLWNFVLPLSL